MPSVLLRDHFQFPDETFEVVALPLSSVTNLELQQVCYLHLRGKVSLFMAPSEAMGNNLRHLIEELLHYVVQAYQDVLPELCLVLLLRIIHRDPFNCHLCQV